MIVGLGAPYNLIYVRYHVLMKQKVISAGTAHTLPTDMQKALTGSKSALAAWETLTPLARNECICWVISVKKDETRKDHINRLIGDLKDGKRRPCCWMGCTHRKDKEISPSVKGVLARRAKKKV